MGYQEKERGVDPAKRYECLECQKVFDFTELDTASDGGPECPACGSRAATEFLFLSAGRLSFMSGGCAPLAGGG